MAKLFGSTDIMAAIDRRMQQTYGLRSNNVAAAYAVYWTSAWLGSRGRTDDPTQTQMMRVKRQAEQALASTPEFAAADDAARQELGEALLVQAALIGETIDQYKSDPALLAKAKAAVVQGAKASGLDLNGVELTDDGFEPTSNIGAVDGGASKRIAALGEAQDKRQGFNLPLLALAGGAGAAGLFLLGRYLGRRN